MVDLKPKIKSKEVRDLLSYCVYNPCDNKIDEVSKVYENNAYCVLLGFMEQDKILGCIGINIKDRDKAIIMHISVKPDERNKGIGKKMIEACLSELRISNISAETDDDAVGFYKRCGFQITDLGEKYIGRRRYLCELRK